MVVGWVDNKGEHPANANVLGGWEKSSREKFNCHYGVSGLTFEWHLLCYDILASTQVPNDIITYISAFREGRRARQMWGRWVKNVWGRRNGVLGSGQIQINQKGKGGNRRIYEISTYI